MKTRGTVALAILLAVAPARAAAPESDAELVFAIAEPEAEGRAEAVAAIEARWKPAFLPMILQLVSISRHGALNRHLIDLMERHSGVSHGYELDAWWRWLWARETMVGSEHARFNELLYGLIDPKIGGYFAGDPPSLIRLDEIVWGGVKQDGIPPLRKPAMIAAREASYLAAGDVVFGLAIGGEARAYPQRILAWHEMFTDTVGGIPLAGVYCTLCGSMVVYRTELGGTVHRLGTSGLLYRSNKLMYDQATQSLWSTLRGEPVLGRLVGEGLELERLPVVTTSWKAWKRSHPETTVLSLETGHQRDYSEGAAYREYFATDELMFPVSQRDRRLANKEPILGLLFDGSPVAISIRFLADHPVHHEHVGARSVIVLTDRGGASRVYEDGGVRFAAWRGESAVRDSLGRRWQIGEDFLEAEDGRRLPRLPAHRAFWFGWYGAFPRTRLVD